jgi:hypothetical protein
MIKETRRVLRGAGAVELSSHDRIYHNRSVRKLLRKQTNGSKELAYGRRILEAGKDPVYQEETVGSFWANGSTA